MTPHDGARGDVRKRACICPPDAVVANCPAHNDWPTAPEFAQGRGFASQREDPVAAELDPRELVLPIPPTFAHELTDGVEEYRAAAASVTALPAEHLIRWTFDRGGVTSEAICNAAPAADCRLTSVACECERWGEIQRRDDGTIWHKIVDYGDSIEPVWHQVVAADYCNVALFINESGCVDELGAGEFTVGEVPIRPLWVDDGCEWEPIPAPTPTERIAQAILAEGARLAAQHHEASEAHGRIKTMAAAFAAVARGTS